MSPPIRRLWIILLACISLLLLFGISYIILVRLEKHKFDNPIFYQAHPSISMVDGRIIAIDNARCLTCGSDGLKIWSLSGRGLPVLHLHDQTTDVEALSISKENNLIAIYKNMTIEIFNYEKQEKLVTIKLNDVAIDVALSSDGKLLAFVEFDKGLTLFDMHRREVVWQGKLRNGVRPSALRFSGDGVTLAIGWGNGAVTLWDTGTRMERKAMVGHLHAVNRLAFSPDGRFLASGAKMEHVILWSLPSGRLLHSFQEPHGNAPVCGLTFLDSGDTLAFSTRHRIQFRNVTSGSLLGTMKPNPTKTAFVGLDGGPKGQWLTIAQQDGKVFWTMR